MPEVTLLVTCIGGGLSAQFVKLLKASRRHTVRVIGTDASRNPVARHFTDAFEIVPRGDDPGFVDSVAAACRKHGVDLVFPCSDEEVLSLSPHKDVFKSSGVTVACNDPGIVDIITDKLATYRKLEKLGVTMPVWRHACSSDELLSALDYVLSATGKAVVKNPSGRGGRGIFVIDNTLSDIERRPGSHELHMSRGAFVDRYMPTVLTGQPVLVMERLVDPVCDLDILAWKGEALTLIPRRRHSSTAPNEGHVLFEGPELAAVGRKIVAALGMSWLFDIDFMTNARGEPIVLEVNPRASGSVSVGMVAGVPLMDDLISLACGERPAPATVPVGRRVYAYNALC